jgi:predicted DNA-binding transcriptional regulator AlpA
MTFKDKKPKSRAARIDDGSISKTAPRATVGRNEPTSTLVSDTPVNRWSDAREPPKLSRIIRKHKLPEYVGVERSAIEDMIEANEFPSPIKVNNSGRILGWLEDEIIAWQQSRRKLRDEGKNPVPKHQPVPPRPDAKK